METGSDSIIVEENVFENRYLNIAVNNKRSRMARNGVDYLPYIRRKAIKMHEQLHIKK